MYKANENRYEQMNYARSGNSGLKLPKISLGLWHNFGTDASYENMTNICQSAFDMGINHFDLANNYGPAPGSAEENFGKILKDGLSGYRDELTITTKAGYGMWEGPYGDGGSRKYLLSSLDQSLSRMGLDYVDIFYHHRMDMDTPLEESMMALDQAVKSGKALYAGISNYDTKTTKKAIEIMKELRCPFVINQVCYNIFNRTIEEDGLKEYAKEAGMGLIAFSPLSQGLLTNRYINGVPSDSRIGGESVFLGVNDLSSKKLEQIKALNEIAQNRGQTLAQMALSWVLKDEEITSVIIGASKVSQVLDNVGAIHKCEFTQEEIKLINHISIS